MIDPAALRTCIHSYTEKVLTIRRHLHQHPELSFEEHKTSAFIAEQLKQAGISFTTGWVKTGIVVEIKPDGYTGNRWLALRADIDALAISEKNNVSYKSVNDGVMHACGHDVHTSVMLGACLVLHELRNNLSTGVRVIFQPGEEKLPGGASLMIKEGALGKPLPEVILGLHVFPEMEVGNVGFRPGMYMASTDEIYITIKGKGGHAAMRNQYNNPLLVASAVLLELEKKFMNESTRVEKEIPTVLAFGKIQGMGATNVIPDEVKLEGTFRTFDEKWRAKAHELITSTVNDVATSMKAGADTQIARGYPFLVNDEKTTTSVRKRTEELLGKEKVHDLELRMTAEDFAYYTQLMPACFFRLGTGNKQKGITSPVHTATFDIDEDALKTGMEVITWYCLQ
ncbi:MAG: M20 family metallopeptidase [Flavobacteriales bacterium]